MYRIIGADGSEYGPVPAAQLRQWIAEGRANAETKALAEGSTEWKPLSSFPEFTTLFAAAAEPKPAVAPPVRPAMPSVAPIRQNNVFAITGLVLAIISFLPYCCCCFCGAPFNIMALVFSIIALVQIRNHPQVYHGQSVAIAGLVLSVLSILLNVIALIFYGLSGSWQQFSNEMNRL